jgi:hypothetical protein
MNMANSNFLTSATAKFFIIQTGRENLFAVKATDLSCGVMAGRDQLCRPEGLWVSNEGFTIQIWRPGSLTGPGT